MKKLAVFLAMVSATLFVSVPNLAHHGETNYDTDKLVSVKATVTSFQFSGAALSATRLFVSMRA